MGAAPIAGLTPARPVESSAPALVVPGQPRDRTRAQMRLFMTRLSIALLSTALLAVGAAANAATWVEGQHYSVISPAQRTNVPAGKVEVMEVFSYGCPACNSFEPTMKKLKAGLPTNAQVVYLPASWNKAAIPVRCKKRAVRITRSWMAAPASTNGAKR